MITLAVASAFSHPRLATQLADRRRGRPHFPPAGSVAPGISSSSALARSPSAARILAYYLIFFAALILFLLLLRVVNSPFGRVLQAIRDNEFRAEAIGYRTVIYRSLASCLAAAAAALAGVLSALWLRYTGPAVTLSFDIMLDILLMVVIGGMGTLYGAVLGAAIFVLAETYLQSLMAMVSHMTAGLPLLPLIVDPDRWLLWLGVLFVLSVYFFPFGIAGRLMRK